MQLAERFPTEFPWRTATLVAGAVAAAELVALIALAAVQLAPAHHAKGRTTANATTAVTAASKPVKRLAPAPSHPLRPRTRVRVLVLNGNGVTGAAAAQAQRLRSRGYRIGGATNAPRHDYARSMVMYAPGWVKEARRLGRDTRVPMVAPLDGLRPAQLRGSKVVLLLGS